MKNTVFVVNYVRTYTDGYTENGIAGIFTSVIRAKAYISAVVNHEPQKSVSGLPMYHDLVTRDSSTAYYTTKYQLDDFNLNNHRGCGVTLDEDDEILEEPDLVFAEEDF